MSKKLKQASTKKTYKITKADLPLSCPSKDMEIWNSHPRVYLPLDENGQAVCPYCDAKYVLKEKD